MRMTVPSRLLATQTEPPPTAMPTGLAPTGTVFVGDRVPGSMRTTLSSSVSATQTALAPTAIPLGPWPTAIGVSRSVARSRRVTVLAEKSVNQAASGPSAIPLGPPFGSTCCSFRAVLGSRRVSKPDDGATQTRCDLVATEPPASSMLPIEVAWPSTVLNRGSISLTATNGFPAGEPTTHTAFLELARPVGVSSTGNVRETVCFDASMRETVWSSRLATQIDPEPAAIAPGLAPTGTSPTTESELGSMTATAFPFTVVPSPEPPWPKANTGTATTAARTPIRAAPAYMRRRLRLSSTSSVFSCAKSLCRPSTSSW